MENTVNEPKDDKVIGVLSYLGILWVVAYIMYGKNKTEYNAFHVKEGLGVLITFIIIAIATNLPIIGGIIYYIGYLAIGILSILGIINAANGEMKPIPVISDLVTKNLLKNFK